MLKYNQFISGFGVGKRKDQFEFVHLVKLNYEASGIQLIWILFDHTTEILFLRSN